MTNASDEQNLNQFANDYGENDMIEASRSVLSIETATPVCSVALRLPDGSLYEKRAEGKGVHSERTFVFIDELLREHSLQVPDLGAVIISAGPGSYTGLRVAGSAAKGLLFETGVALYACHTLGAFALGARQSVVRDQNNVKPAGYGNGMMKASGDSDTGFMGCDAVMDARRNHLYHQSWRFQGEGVEPESVVAVRELEEVLEIWKSGRLLVGTGVERLKQLTGVTSGITGSLPMLDESDVISAVPVLRALDRIPLSQLDKLIKKVAPEHFEPYYYTGL